MQNHQENPATLEDIVFQNRNKSYGAYSLRIDYQNVIKKSLLIGISIFGLAVLTPMLWAKVDDRGITVVDAHPLGLEIPPPPEKIEQPKIETPPPVEPEAPIESIKFTQNIEIVDTDDPVEQIPDQQTLTDFKGAISDKNQEGIIGEIPVGNPDEGNGTQPEMPVAVKTEEADKEYITVEQNPEFAGGRDALIRFLQKNLRYPSPAANAGVGGKVYMQFVVGQDGAIRNVDVLKGIGFGCDEEAQRVVKLMPHWSPGRQSGRAVSVKFTLPISFQLSE
jgi:periplasmic protein TonB